MNVFNVKPNRGEIEKNTLYQLYKLATLKKSQNEFSNHYGEYHTYRSHANSTIVDNAENFMQIRQIMHIFVD